MWSLKNEFKLKTNKFSRIDNDIRYEIIFYSKLSADERKHEFTSKGLQFF